MTTASIIIQAPADRPDVLDIRDAMGQVFDYFELLADNDGNDDVVWNFIVATMNSPFRAETCAVSRRPGVDVNAVATDRILTASAFMSARGRGESSLCQVGPRGRRAARRIWERNTKGIGKTIFSCGNPEIEDVVITPASARVALKTSDRDEKIEFDYLPDSRQRTEHGSIEGTLDGVVEDYNQPAIRVIERKSGKAIICRVDQSVIDNIAQEVSFRDVWEHRRVLVRGRIEFDQHGKIVRVHARSITLVAPMNMTLKDIEDPDFTGSISINDYIDKLREGSLGL
jgi:hypothetical protein